MHWLVREYANESGLAGQTATHLHVELSAKVPGEQPGAHMAVRLSANEFLEHVFTQKLSNGSANVYLAVLFGPAVVPKKHAERQSLVSLSPYVPGGQSGMQIFELFSP
jgi:hypothetical protein